MTFDTNAILIVVAILAAVVLGFLVLRGRRRTPRVERRPDGQSPYVASRDRPYMRPSAADGPQGNSVADEVAAATTDVAGEMLGIKARADMPGGGADLTLLKGVGPKFAAQLKALGIARYEQLAGLSDTEIAHLDERLGAFSGRLARDRVREQAAYLARGDIEGFEEKFGKLGG